MPSALRSVAVLAFASAAAFLFAPACSMQGEGERCDFAKNGDLDCDSGFTCVKANDLADHATDRCCPDANTESDSRCARSTGNISTGGSGGSSTGNGGAPDEPNGGSGAETAGGTPSVPASGDGGMVSSAGTPATDQGGAAPVEATGGNGGAP